MTARTRHPAHAGQGGQFTAPVKEIYKGWALIRARWKRGDRSITDQLEEIFGIQYWEWSRLKVLYENATDGGDGTAKKLVAAVDSGDLTVSMAYSELQRHLEDTANPPTPVKLREVRDAAAGAVAYAETLATNLARGATLNTYGMTESDIDETIRKLKRAGHFYRKAADSLSRTRSTT